MTKDKAKATELDPEETVVVRRHWNAWMTATVKLKHLQNLHWDDTSGGVNVRSPHVMMYGYIYCDQIVSGELNHSCAHGPGPHRIKVVVVQVDNPKPLIKRLKAQIAERIAEHERTRLPRPWDPFDYKHKEKAKTAI